MVGRQRIVKHWTGSYRVQTGAGKPQPAPALDQTRRALSSFLFDFRNGDPQLSRVIQEIHGALYPSAAQVGPNVALGSSTRDFDRVERDLQAASQAGRLSILLRPPSSPSRRHPLDYQKLASELVENQDEELSFLEIVVVDEDGNPAGNITYEVLLPDGHTRRGMLGSSGKTTLRDIPSGNCKLTFPELDGASWTAHTG